MFAKLWDMQFVVVELKSVYVITQVSYTLPVKRLDSDFSFFLLFSALFVNTPPCFTEGTTNLGTLRSLRQLMA